MIFKVIDCTTLSPTCALHGRLDCKASTLKMDLYMKLLTCLDTQLQPQDKFERTPHLISAAVRLVNEFFLKQFS